MADERRRHRIYEAFKASHGEETAVDLLESLPPVGLSDLATKHDVAMLRSDLDALDERSTFRLEATEHRLSAQIERELRRQTVRFVAWMLAGFTAFGAAVGATVQLF